MRVAVVGCGNIATFYLGELKKSRKFEIAGVMDRDEERAKKSSAYYSVPMYVSFDELLDDKKVDIVVNLTNPRSHFAVSKACLEAGKHVYSEKPLAMKFAKAKQLVNLAKRKGLYISSAPSRVLAEAAQTMWKALREETIGKVRLVYAEMDGGLVHRMPYQKWKNELGIPWPYKDEFEVGCTIEHGAYSVTCLTVFFGPVETVTAFSSCQIPDKLSEEALAIETPDFSVASLKFKSGIVARLTCSLIAPSDHSIKIFGDDGILFTDDIWKPRSQVWIKRFVSIGRKTITSRKTKYPFVREDRRKGGTREPSVRNQTKGILESLKYSVRSRMHHLKQRVNFCLGVNEMASAIQEARPSRLSAEYCLHTTEVVLAIQDALETGAPKRISTTFDPMMPMPWASE